MCLHMDRAKKKLQPDRFPGWSAYVRGIAGPAKGAAWGSSPGWSVFGINPGGGVATTPPEF